VAYNTEHGIQPVSIIKAVRDITQRLTAPVGVAEERGAYSANGVSKERMSRNELERVIGELEKQMKALAKELEFEKAAALRDQVYELRAMLADESDLPPWKKARLLAGEE
jgi:excinuclease ABC subunit B